jgi:hypothetical protein
MLRRHSGTVSRWAPGLRATAPPCRRGECYGAVPGEEKHPCGQLAPGAPAGLGLRPTKEKAPAQGRGKEDFGNSDRLLRTSRGPEMSIRITSMAEFFRCMRPAATLQERRAALYKLVRMLAGDARRRLSPQISLPGRPLPATAPATAPAATVRYFRQALPTGKVINTLSKDSDAREPYSREQLHRMDARFRHALARAIAHGQEQVHV